MGDNLALDRRHWNVVFGGRNNDEFNEHIFALLAAEGAPLQSEDHRGLIQHNAIRHLQAMMAFTRQRYTLCPTGQMTSTASHELHASLHLDERQLTLHLNELAAPLRSVRFVEDEDYLEFTLLGDMVLRYVQRPGRVELSEMWDGKYTVWQAATFAELYDRHPPSH